MEVEREIIVEKIVDPIRRSIVPSNFEVAKDRVACGEGKVLGRFAGRLDGIVVLARRDEHQGSKCESG
jgi:hypothetical protein